MNSEERLRQNLQALRPKTYSYLKDDNNGDKKTKKQRNA